MGLHSVTCHPAEVTFPPLPQPKLVLSAVLSTHANSIRVQQHATEYPVCINRTTVWKRIWTLQLYLGWHHIVRIVRNLMRAASSETALLTADAESTAWLMAVRMVAGTAYWSSPTFISSSPVPFDLLQFNGNRTNNKTRMQVTPASPSAKVKI